MKLAEMLAQHAPYLSKRSDSKLCLRCLDDDQHGEFDTVDAWADHVAAEIRRAGYRLKPVTADAAAESSMELFT